MAEANTYGCGRAGGVVAQSERRTIQREKSAMGSQTGGKRPAEYKEEAECR